MPQVRDLTRFELAAFCIKPNFLTVPMNYKRFYRVIFVYCMLRHIAI